ncbi:MAG: M42 family metallopeptidase [Firmicutes bacterium]|nr:M42 family metallopeptidase [Bacillota bacterium]
MRKKSLKKYTDFIVKEAQALLALDSPTGYTENAAAWVLEEFKKLGYAPKLTVKGGVLVKLSDGGAVSPINDEDANYNNQNNKDLSCCDASDRCGGLLLEAHADTLGGMVSKIKPEGRLELTNLGGMNANNAEAENVRIVTKYNGIYEGTCQLVNASVHVNGKYNDTKREWSAMEIVLDEPVKKDKDVEKLGIAVGDIICFEPRTRVTKSGYIKSRFLDDKLSVAILLGYAMYLRDSGAKTTRPVWAHITTYEEVGHGGSGSVPEGVTEALSVDMGCVGEGLSCTERQVSICAKDSGGPYSYEIVKGLIDAAKRSGADYAVDIYPHYGSDVEATLAAGYDVKHGLIGAGVYASHGYERSHRDGAENTLRLLIGYTE